MCLITKDFINTFLPAELYLDVVVYDVKYEYIH